MKRLAALIRTPAGTAAAAVLCCALWGSAFPVIKTSYAVIGIASDDWKTQILFAGIRFFTAGVITVILGSLIADKFLIPKKTSLGKIPVLALFQTVLQYLFFYIGLAFTTGTKGSVLNSVSVFFSVILASFVIKSERLTALKAVGCAVGFAGVVAVNLGAGLNAGFSIKGEGFIILSSLSYAISSVLIKRFSEDESPVVLSGYQFMLGGAVMTAVSLILGARLVPGIRGVAIILYLALLSAVAYTLWGVLLKYNEVSRVTVYSFMIPVFGCIFSALLLGEKPYQSGAAVFIALVLVCAGIITVNKSKGDILNEG